MKKYNCLWLVSAMAALTACSDYNGLYDDTDKEAVGSATFVLQTCNKYGIAVTSRSEDDATAGDGENAGENEGEPTPEPDPVTAPEGIAELQYVLCDSEGRILNHHYSTLSSDFSKLSLEGLQYGSYSIMFLGTGTGSEGTTTESPETTAEPWLVNGNENSPINTIHYYQKVDFTIGFDHAPVNEKVELGLAVARVDLSLSIDNPSLWRHIKKIKVSFNDEIPTSLNADGTYSGSHVVKEFELPVNSPKISFTTLPSERPVDGFVEIISSADDGADFSNRYSFSGLRLEKGMASRINIAYRHPEQSSGRIYVASDQIWRFPTDTMFMSDEPREVFYNTSRRSFYVNAPLKIGVDGNHKLLVQYFSPMELKNVRVLGRFNKMSTEWFDLAYFETIPAFFEGMLYLPIVDRECVFKTTTGRNIRIPAQANLTAQDLDIKFETDDEFMKKISTIDSKWYIRFSKFGADSGHANWRHMTPILCRHGVALALNMAFMFASQEFSDALDTYDGILFDNSKNPIDLNALRNKIRNHGGLQLGCVVGVGGLGGGQTYGLADYCYTGVYHDATAANANPHNYARQAMFHEYGHCLGYNHTSNMTYGDKWTVLCATVFVQLGREGKLPVPNRTDVTSLPFQR